jgi:hypothetical protein
VAPLVGDRGVLSARLLLYLSHDGDVQRAAVGPALAAVAEAAGWEFECYYGAFRRGRHFGGGDPDAAAPGAASGSLVAGGRHAERAASLATLFEVVALGDPQCILWPALEAAGAEPLARTSDPAELYEVAFARLGQPLPQTVLVLDSEPQGGQGVVVAPYLYPQFLDGELRLGLDVSSDAELRHRVEALGASEFRGLYVDPGRAEAFPGGLAAVEGDVNDDDYASLTAALAERHRSWGKGVLLGDPALVAAQLPKARRLRLLPLYGRPQTEVIERSEQIVQAAREPVFGRQFDDRDFFALARLGHGLQVIDPDPPFDAPSVLATRVPAPSVALVDTEPAQAELERWAEEGRVLISLLFWCGMVREIHCLPPLFDLIAITGARVGLVLTADVVEHADPALLTLLGAPVERGGVFGLVEPLLGSTGRGVAAESLLPEGALAASLAEARTALGDRLPAELAPRGWWPLLDTPLVATANSSRFGRRGKLPVLRFEPRGAQSRGGSPGTRPPRRDMRGLAGSLVRTYGLERFFEQRRPFDDQRPAAIDEAVAEAVRGAGFEYMWTKAAFGRPAAALSRDEFVALPFTAGNWDGWSPFYTVSGARDLARAERRLLRSGDPGWLAGTIDSPLWLLPGELLERGSGLYRIAQFAAAGGRSGKLVNVTPNVIARYSRLLDSRPSDEA